MLRISIGLISRACKRKFSTKSWDYDVIIGGGGIVGAALAANLCRLSENKLRICIVDQKQPPKLKDCMIKSVPDERVYALSPRSIKFLADIGAWQLMAERKQPYNSMQIWEKMSPGIVRFHASDLDISNLGSIAEDSTILAALYEIIDGKVDFRWNSSISAFHVQELDLHSIGPANVVISTKSDNKTGSVTLSTRLLVGADGAASTVRRLADISTYGWTYGQEAVVGTVKLDLENSPDYDQSTAYQIYLPEGPLALLPLWGGYASFVWSMPVSQARRTLSMSFGDFISLLNETFQLQSSSFPCDSTTEESESIPSAFKILRDARKGFLSAVDLALSTSLVIDPKRPPPHIKELCSTKLLSFPLQLQHASTYYRSRVALVGDAAHSIHPQAGQGLNLGLGDALEFSRIIVSEGLNSGQDFGDDAVLKKYHVSRYLANAGMMGSVDVINRVFKDPQESDLLSLIRRTVRSTGMIGIHNLPSIKKHIAKFATGLE